MSDIKAIVQEIGFLLNPPINPQRLSQAHDLCLKSISEHPNNHIFLALMGSILMHQNRYDVALEYLSKNLQLSQDKITANLLVGSAYFGLKDIENAVAHHWRVIEKDVQKNPPNVTGINVDAMSVVGYDAFRKGNYQEALRLYSAVIGFVADDIQTKEKSVTATPNIETNKQKTITARKVHPILYLPVEVKAREFESKLLLATIAANAGLTVILGQSWGLLYTRGKDLPPGIVLFKTLNGLDGRNMGGVVNNGHLVATLDEEAFARSDSDVVFKVNTDEQAIVMSDVILTQGVAHSQVLGRVFPGHGEKTRVVGNPKADLFSPSLRHAVHKPSLELPAGSEKIILFCMMSGNINSAGRTFTTCAHSTLKLGGQKLSSPVGQEFRKLFLSCVEYEIAIAQEIGETVAKVANHFPDNRIVVRPHPIEEASVWESRFADIPNVTIRTDGAFTSWLPHAAAIVHVSGCGTGLEAHLAGVPAIRFEGSGRVADPNTGISSKLNIPAKNYADVINILSEILQDKNVTTSEDGLNMKAQFLLQDPEKLSSEMVVDSILDTLKGKRRTDHFPIDYLIKLGQSRSMHFQPTPFHRNKFPETNAEEVLHLVDRMSSALRLDAALAVSEIDDNIFLVRRSLAQRKNISKKSRARRRGSISDD